MIQNATARQLAGIRNQKKIGFVFQFFNLLPKLNLQQNVELPMIYSGLSARERRERSLEALETGRVWKIAAKHRSHANLRGTDSNAPPYVTRAPW